MMVTIESGAVCGMRFTPVRVEVDVADGFPCFEMVGYLGSEVREARERVRVALQNIGFPMPSKRITVNLAPADVHKAGTGFDLPVAVGILAAMGYIPEEHTKGLFMTGEVGLNGELRPVRGILPMVRQAAGRGITHCMVPKENEQEGAVIQSVKITGVEHLSQVCEYLQLPLEERDRYLPPAKVSPKDLPAGKEEKQSEDFEDIVGQEGVRRAVEVASAGFHHLLMLGPPGAGKTMIAKRMPGILPPLTLQESLEVSEIYSVAGLLKEEALITKRPFLNPHHTISESALIGGGRIPRPGAVSLAHHSVLFLDEFGEFQRKTLDLLRQPLEEKEVHIARASGNYTFPADFLLVAAMNPCPCGYYPDKNKCRCSPNEIKRYLAGISGPILDRIDICVEAVPLRMEQLCRTKKGESSAVMRERILQARKRQEHRYQETAYHFNSQLAGRDVARYCFLGEKEETMLKSAFQSMELSARSYHRILKVARTIADLEDSDEIRQIHLTEAICYRMLDKKYWTGK